MAIEKMGKFSLIFDIGGSGPATLDRALDTVKGLGDEANKTQAKLGGLLDSFGNARVKEFAEDMMAIGSKGFDLFSHGLVRAVETVMPLESALQRIGSATKLGQEASRGILENFLQLAAKTPFTEEQVIGLGMALTQAKVSLDAFTDKSGKVLTIQDALNEGWAKGNKELIEQSENLKSLKIDSLTLLGDLASMQGKTGEQMDFFIRAFQKALSTGQLQSLAGDITLQQREKIFGTTGGSSKVTAQQAMNNLFEYLKTEGQIGAMAAGGATMEGMMSTLKDIPGQLYRNILGMPGSGGLYDRIKAGFADLVGKLGAYFSDPEFLSSAKEALMPIVNFLLMMAEAVKKAGLAVLEFIKKNPQVTKMVASFVFFGSIVLMLIGALFGLATMIGGISTAISLFGTTVLTVLGPGLAIVLAFSAAVAGLIAIGYVLYEAYDRNFGGLKDTLEGVFAVFKGLSELLGSLNGSEGEMSIETANLLDAHGLLDLTIQIFGYIVRIKEFMTGVFEGFAAQWDVMYRIIKPSLDALGVALNEFLSILGDVAKAFGMTITPNDLMNWKTAGQIVGVVLAGAFRSFANSVQAAVTVLTLFLELMSGAFKAAKQVGQVGFMGTLLNPGTTLLGAVSAAVQPRAPDHNRRAQMLLDTPEKINSEVTSNSVKRMERVVEKSSSVQRGGQVETMAEVVLDGERVGRALMRSHTRDKYLKHDGPSTSIMTPDE